jgi:type II secretory pathway predicted ATPase ExeA
MNDKQLLALYGLKYNPFLPDIPIEALWQPPGIELFITRINNLVTHGGFALISGEAGLGKSKILQILANRLGKVGDLVVGVMERPQSSMADFYRELGEVFNVNLTPANRYGGFRALRTRWRDYIKSTLLRPVLLVDEAQEMPSECLNELRLLGSAHFDSQCLLTTVVCGDNRLPQRFRSYQLLSLGSRIRTRLKLDPLEPADLMEYLEHSLDEAGAHHLMSQQLKNTLCEHAAGNLRLLANMAAELLAAGANRNLATLDESLYLELFSPHIKAQRKKRKTATG